MTSNVGYGSFTDTLNVFDSAIVEGTIFLDDESYNEDSNIIATSEYVLENSSGALNSNNLESFNGETEILKASYSLNGGDFDDIQNIIDDAEPGDTIVLNGNFVARDDSMISINKRLTITSTNGATLDGRNKVRIFNIKSNAQGTIINNLVFKNGYVGNTRGGAILLNVADVVVNNCEFYGNSAFSGGAIATAVGSVDADNLVVKNSRFYFNHATAYAGAILSESKNLEITSCIFESNYVALKDSVGGGGVLQLGMENVDNNCKIINSTFNNNYISSNGANYGHGGVACLRRGVSFDYCNFTNNSAHDGGALSFHDGGSVTNCKFHNNHAENNGGAIIIDTAQQGVVISQSYFANNYAVYGGAIYNNGDLNLNVCIFQMNRAISKMQVISPVQVKCSDDAIIRVILEGGNNIANALWSNNPITIDGKSVNPNNRISSQSVGLNVGGMTFISTTNVNGEAIFKFNTKNFNVQRYLCVASFSSNDYFGTSKNFNLDIIKKVVYKTKIKNKKKIKKIKKYQAYIPTPKYVKVKYKIQYYNPNIINHNPKVHSGVKKIKKFAYKWKNVSKKSLNSKYKWCKSKYCYVTKYKATKTKFKYVNGKLVKKSVNKKYKYSKKSKYKNIRTKDWSIYVLPSVDCESDNGQIIKFSKKIIKNEAKRLKKSVSKLTDSQKAHAILYYVQKYVVYKEYGDTRRGAVKTLKDKKGNCADQSHLSVALLRAANIPAKYESKVVKLNGKNTGHAWHFAYFKNKWWAGESTDDINCPKYGKSKFLHYYIKSKAVDNLHKVSHKFISKFVKYNNVWCKVYEQQFINNKWEVYHGDNWNSGALTSIQYTVGGNIND